MQGKSRWRYYKSWELARRLGRRNKSAYRRLARKRHPDVNGGSERAARDFALIALAYRTLSDPHERAYYDAQRERLTSADSVFHSNNPHARRMRRMAAQARWDRAVDRWIESERREACARTQAVFPTVTLFLSTFFVAMLKPPLWQTFDHVGRAVLVTLFLIGLWHLAVRLRACFERYTYQPKRIQDSIINEHEEKSSKPFTRFSASAFLITGMRRVSPPGCYWLARTRHSSFRRHSLHFGQSMRPDLLFYPPIAVLIVDTMHTVASKID